MSATLINGETTTCIPVSDRAFQYGDGVFETIRISRRTPTLWSLHLKRLLAGCQYLGIPVDARLIEAELFQLLATNPSDGIAKLLISRGSGGRGYQPPAVTEPLRIAQFYPLPAELDLRRDSGIRTRLCSHPISRNGSLTRFKHLCRLDQVIASGELSEAFPEGIMLTEDEQVIEGTRSNLFLVSGGELVTPSLQEAGIHGVMREYLINRFAGGDVSVNEVKQEIVSLETLRSASELFFCNSVFGIWPVTELQLVDGPIPYAIGPFAQRAGEFVDDAFVLEN
ncbi:MAG: aminodeoxychorismate lyase [Gammaproteobacteria bacterium]